MTAKAWTAGEIRTLARKTVDGRKTTVTARGQYFRALLETAQAELGGESGQEAQRAALRAVHRRFYPIVQNAIATDEILQTEGFTRKDLALERNRRMNFARSAHGTIQRWLRASGHDLMKLDAAKTTKSQLLNEAPPTRKHALTPQRVQARAGKLIDGLLSFTRQIAKVNQAQAESVVKEAMNRLVQLLGDVKPTTDAHVAAQEGRPLRVGKSLFLPTELSQPARAKAA